jgi:Pregnancy-associated plasma protein-A
MFQISSAATALFGAVFALASIDNAYACALHHTADKHQSDDPPAGSVQVLRSLIEDNEGAPETKFICGTPDLAKNEVKAFANMVDQFYQGPPGSPGDSRSLQQPEPIAVNVNFVNVRNSAGAGATNAQVNDQMSWLNGAFDPDFVQFKLVKLQEVINDNFFGTISYDDVGKAIETQMKMAHKIGGMETLSIYSVDTSLGGVSGIGGWAYYPAANAGVLDGVVILYSSLPGGGHRYWTQGDVSFEALHVASCTQWIVSILMLLYMAALHSGLLNKALVHEVGHWLGLPHTFNGYNRETAPTGGCTPPGDGIDDTPAEASPPGACGFNPPRDTCPGPGTDPVDNYMSYVPDVCMDKFTSGQRAAMRAAWFTYRAPAQPVPAPVSLPQPVPQVAPVPLPEPTNKPVPRPTDKPVPMPVPVKAPVPVPVMAMLPVPVVANAPVPVPAAMTMKTMGMKEMGMKGMMQGMMQGMN